MSLNIHDISIVHWFPQGEKHKCGYCKSQSGSISYGMWADSMTVKDYQNLIDRGWRRSGRYCYKPIMNEVCCPQYTIRCDALNFKMSKSHKKVIKRFNKYINDGILYKNLESTDNANDHEDAAFVSKERPNIVVDYKSLNTALNEVPSNLNPTDPVPTCSRSIDTLDHNTGGPKLEETVVQKTKVVTNSENIASNAVKKGLGADPNKFPCKKAKLLRIEKKQHKMREKGFNFVKSNASNEAKSLEQFLCDLPNNCNNKLQIKLVSMNSDEETQCNIEYELYKKYQTIIHNDPPEKCSKSAFIRFLVNSPLKMKLERMNRTHETFEISHKLYIKYQMFVHGDIEGDCDEEQFVDFLVDTPLKPEKWRSSEDLGFGSFHQQYWIEDKLVAVGVIDILPKCVSSVYFFYDPDYRSLTLGTYGSLREIEFTRKLLRSMPSIKYYYMGFYIHSCPKMRYKGKLVPSDLLCPETYKWFPITQCIPKLEQQKYCRFSDDPGAIDEDACSSSDIDQFKIFVFDGYVKFKHYNHRNSERKIYQNIGKLVGKKCVNSLLFVKPRH